MTLERKQPAKRQKPPRRLTAEETKQIAGGPEVIVDTGDD